MRKDPTLVEIGHRIQTIRREKGVSQEALAHIAGLHRTFLGMVERGERNITVINLLRITTALEVDASQILQELRVSAKLENLD